MQVFDGGHCSIYFVVEVGNLNALVSSLLEDWGAGGVVMAAIHVIAQEVMLCLIVKYAAAG